MQLHPRYPAEPSFFTLQRHIKLSIAGLTQPVKEEPVCVSYMHSFVIEQGKPTINGGSFTRVLAIPFGVRLEFSTLH